MKNKLFLLVFTFSAFALKSTTLSVIVIDTIRNPFAIYFEEAYRLYPEIPKGILEAIAYTNTHFHHTTHAADEPESCTGIPQSYGIMGLMLDAKGVFRNNLITVSKLSGYSKQKIISDPRINILAFAKSYVIIKKRLKIVTNDIGEQMPVIIEISEFLSDDDMKNNFPINSHCYSVLSFLSNVENQKVFSFPKYQIDFIKIFGQENYKKLSSSNSEVGK